MGLNKYYNAIKGNILMMCPLSSIGHVYSMLIQEEKQREIRSAGHFMAISTSLVVETHKALQFPKGRMDRDELRIDQPYGRFKRNEGKKHSIFCNTVRNLVIQLISVIDFMIFHQILSSKKGERTAALAQIDDQDTDHHGSIQSLQTTMPVPYLTS